MSKQEIIHVLEKNLLRKELVNHALFQEIGTASLSRGKVAIILGQWWHPLHYFPNFLSKTIAVVPTVEMKTAISTILYQELGESRPEMAHEKIYIDTMLDAGFLLEEISGAHPYKPTEELVAGYERASGDWQRSLGYIYGTEVADLVMVSSIGRAVSKVTDKRFLPWVDIHINQEPDHVEKATAVTQPTLSAEDRHLVIAGAEEIWRLWIAFFNYIRSEVSLPLTSDTATS